jgi:dihydrodipicolinate synthase/N-acetylneuraminate lyase
MSHKKNPNAQALGRLGGKARAEKLSDAEIAKIARKGGTARAAKLTAAERSRIAKLAVAARERKRRGKS